MGKENIVVGLQATNTVKVGNYGASEESAADLGLIDGGISVSHGEEQYDVEVDQIIGILRSITTKEEFTFKMSLAEVTLANLAIAWGYPTTAVDGSTFYFGGKTSNTERTVYLNVRGAGAEAATAKITIWRCVSTGNSGHSYMKGDKTLIELEFKVLVDTSKTAEQQFGKIEVSGADITRPTIAMTTPSEGGTRTAGGKTTVVLTITEAGLMDENSIKYGNDDDATIAIYKEGTPNTLLAGAIVYSAAAKTVTFTPTENWEAGTYHVAVTTGLRDAVGNRLASQYLTYLTVSA